MAKRIVYICGRDRDLNISSMSLKNGVVLYQVKNYSELLEEPRELQRDECCYALYMDESKIKKLQSDPPGILRAWEGPENDRGYPQYMVQGEIYSIVSPLDAGAADGQELNALRKSSDELLAKYGETKEALDQAQQQIATLSGRDEAALKAFINEADDAVLEAMPHIGPETVTNLRAWAQSSDGPAAAP